MRHEKSNKRNTKKFILNLSEFVKNEYVCRPLRKFNSNCNIKIRKLGNLVQKKNGCDI